MRWSLFCLLLLLAQQTSFADDGGDDAMNDDYYAMQQDDAANYNPYDYNQKVEPCEKGVVQVTSISLECNSPYTFYYGNGANRNSPVCDYGDKATVAISFTVTDDLDEGADIYMKMAAYFRDEQLYIGDSVEVCQNYVGGDCAASGEYSFKKKIQFAYLDGTYKKFVPTFEIAFSDDDDGTYRLGGVNIYCADNNDDQQEDDQYTINWNATPVVDSANGFANVMMDYGILMGTIVVIVGFAGFLWYNNREASEIAGPDDPKAVGLLIMA